MSFDETGPFTTGDLFAGRYQMIRQLGRGGMGEVWSALDRVLSTEVALKVVPGVSQRSRAALLNEVRLARQITHPAICRVFDVGESGGLVFYTMELVDGEDLAARLSRVERLSSDEVTDIARQLCSGLAAAHEEGVVHRDLKPANVLIDRKGQVRITDFGIAVTREAAGITGPIGTPAYMAPEQLVPGRALTEQTDLYSLGLVLYELLRGKRLFNGAEPRVDPATLSTAQADVDPDLDAAIHWALALSPKDRPPSASALARRLPAPTSVLRAVDAGARRRLAVPRVAALFVGVLAIAALGALWFVRRPIMPAALNERDTIVLADFDNATGEPVFDGTLNVALAVALEQSPFVKVFSGERIAETLRLMQQPPDIRLTRTLARDVARREQLKALVAGSIASLGSHYVLALEAINAESGDSMARAQEEASSREEVLTALGRAASGLRQKLGESLASVQRFDVALPNATTASLDALHAYALALDDGRVNMRLSAIPQLQRAIELDPNFAMAHAMLSGVYANTDQPGIAPEYAKRAFDLRARVSERERFFISWRYYRDGAFAFDKALELTRSWTETYPREAVAFNSLALTLKDLGQYEPAIDAYRESMRLDPKFFAPYGNLAEAALAVNNLNEAAATLALAEERTIEGAAVRRVSYLLAMLRRDPVAMTAAITRAGSLAETNPLQWDARTAAFEGRVSDAHVQFSRAVALALERGLKESAAQFLTEDAEAHAIVGQCTEARGELARALTMSRDIFSLQRATRGYAWCGAEREAHDLRDELLRRFPEAFLARRVLLPVADAILALQRRQTEEVRRLLAGITPYENVPLGELWPWYLQGALQLQLKNGTAAEAAFQQVLDHQGIRPSSVAHPLARLGLARAAQLANAPSRAKTAYDAFLAVWNDERLTAVREANAERAKVSSVN